MKKVLIGADSYGFRLKEAVKKHLEQGGLEVEDVGVHGAEEGRAYYDVAAEVASQVSQGNAERGLLVCGTGMGMAIIANKAPGVYAAVCQNPTAAKHSRSINNSNVLTLGGLVTSEEKAGEIVDAWLNTEFTSGWDTPIQVFLRNSVTEIRSIERRTFGHPREKG